MSGTEQVMAILLEAEDIRIVHPEWPMNMRLSMCLMPSGDCQILLFRQEEADRFPERLRKHLGLRAEELSLHPEVEGFPTRTVSYSDERNLAALLADAPNLLEDASDYAVNYSYALEEGLDPVAFLGREAAPAAAPVVAKADAALDLPEMATDTPLQFQSRRPKPEPEVAQTPIRNLSFDLAREAARFEATRASLADPSAASAPGQGFLSADQLSTFETPPGQYSLAFEDGWFELSRGAGEALKVTEPTHLFMRDDHQLLAIRRDADHMPPRIRLAAAQMPKVMQLRLKAALGHVQVMAEDGFIFVTLPKPAETDVKASVKTLAPPRKARLWQTVRRSRSLRLFALTSVTTVAIFFILNAQPGEALSEQKDRAIDWSQFRLSQVAP